MTMPGGAELFVILFIVLLLFGAKKLPDLAGSVGKSLKEFKKATKEGAAEAEDAEDTEDAEGDTAGEQTAELDDGATTATGRDRDR
jgi:sec-independent protein translocase protein TatA